MKRATKGKATKAYARGKRVSIYVKEGDGHAKSIGMMTAIFWETDGTYLYYRESYQGKTLKIRWEEIDNVVPVAQRSKVGVAIKGEDVRSQKAREISEEADRGHEINATAPITITKPTRRTLSVDEVVFMLGELQDDTSVSDIRGVLEVHDGSVRVWKKRIASPPDRESGWFKRHVGDEIGAWFDDLWTPYKWQVETEPKQAVVRTGDGKLVPVSGPVLEAQPDGDPLVIALEARVNAVEQTICLRNEDLNEIERNMSAARLQLQLVVSEISALELNLSKYKTMLNEEYEVQSGTKESDDNGTS